MNPPTHEFHHLYRIFPAMDLVEHAGFAFGNANAHFVRVVDLLKTPGIQTLWEEDRNLDERTKAERRNEVNAFHRHLRALLWELVASFDTILQWANQEYQLGLDEHLVKFNGLPNTAGRNQLEWDKKHALLDEAWNSAWYFEVRAYRNFTHRAFANVTAVIVREPPGDRAMHVDLLPVREGQAEHVPIEDHLRSYLERMQALGLAVLPIARLSIGA